MSYENAEPKILKTLNSSGEVLDDSGNVIADTTDYWKKLYNEAEPKPDKILHSDGTIKDSAGNLIQDTTPFNVKKYNQAEPIPAKYLHADGSIDENSGGNKTLYYVTDDNGDYWGYLLQDPSTLKVGDKIMWYIMQDQMNFWGVPFEVTITNIVEDGEDSKTFIVTPDTYHTIYWSSSFTEHNISFNF